MKFNTWITGSKYSNADLKLYIFNTQDDKRYNVSTCFNSITIYKSAVPMNINGINRQINSDRKKINISN
jgi:hypothetical protein